MTNASGSVVIVGGGQAAMSAAAELRRLKYPGTVTILTDEPYLPYKRPPLSKGFLLGTVAEEQLLLRAPAALEKAGIACRTACRVETIDRDRCVVTTAGGEDIPYIQLILATGGKARSLPIAGGNAANVLTLRGIDDVKALQKRVAAGQRAAIIGGGYIGLELAAVLCKKGVHTTLMESLPRVLERVASPRMSQFIERVHREAGVDLRTGCQVKHFKTNEEGEVSAVVIANGDDVPVDFVVVGIGLEPHVGLAEAAGLGVENGIVVDEYCRTDDPDIYAIGDCCNYPSARYSQRLRLESVQNAQDQGRIVARNIVGDPVPYNRLPWFWSDQYDLKLQMAGLRFGACEEVLRGDPESGHAFSIFYLQSGVLVAADSVNRPADFMAARKLIEAGCVVRAEDLADEAKPLTALLS